MIVKLLIYRTGMSIKGPDSWWIAKSITPQLVVNQSKINPQLPSHFLMRTSVVILL